MPRTPRYCIFAVNYCILPGKRTVLGGVLRCNPVRHIVPNVLSVVRSFVLDVLVALGSCYAALFHLVLYARIGDTNCFIWFETALRYLPCPCPLFV